MANVFIFSTDDETTRSSYDIATKKGHKLETLLPLIQEKDRIEYLKRIYPDGICYVWGVRETRENFSTWDFMEEQDLLLCFRNGSVVSTSYLLMKMNHPSLAERIWSENAGEPFGLMCFVDEPHTGEVPIVTQLFRYLDPDCRGFAKLDSEKRDHILSDYGSFETFVRLGLGYNFPFSLRHSE